MKPAGPYPPSGNALGKFRLNRNIGFRFYIYSFGQMMCKSSSTESLEAGECDLGFSVMIVYDRASAGVQAVKMVDRLIKRLEWSVEFQPELWRFDMIEHPSLRETATTDASRAQMLVVAVDGSRDLPAGITEWLQSCQTKSDSMNAALVALLHPRECGKERVAPVCQFLRTVAESSGRAFFCSEAMESGDLGKSGLQSGCRPAAHSTWFQRMIELSPQKRGWGLNE